MSKHPSALTLANLQTAMGGPYRWPDPTETPHAYLAFGRHLSERIRATFGEERHRDVTLLCGLVADEEWWRWQNAQAIWNGQRRNAGEPATDAALVELAKAELEGVPP